MGLLQEDGFCYFEITNVEPTCTDEPFYCLKVSSPTKQFLIGEDSVPTHNTDEGKEIDALKGEAQLLIGSIARLGRASLVFLALAFQRPDASMIPGETRDNFGARVGYGTLRPNGSRMLFDDMTGTRIQSKPKGRVFIKIYDKGNKGQGFYASPDWLDKWLDKQGLNKDGSRKGTGSQSKIINTEGYLGNAKTLDELEGNNKVLDYITTEEGIFENIEPTQNDNTNRVEVLDFDDNTFTSNDPVDTWDDELDTIIAEQDSFVLETIKNSEN